MNRLGFLVLSILQAEATDRLSAMTIHEIAETEEDLGLKENTVFKKIRDFEKLGYIGRGLKEGRANTFYITQEGCRFLKGEKHNEE